jgi:hypothetical protein
MKINELLNGLYLPHGIVIFWLVLRPIGKRPCYEHHHFTAALKLRKLSLLTQSYLAAVLENTFWRYYRFRATEQNIEWGPFVSTCANVGVL